VGHFTAKTKAFFEKYLNDPHVTWKYTRREIARINLVAKWFAANDKNALEMLDLERSND